MVEPNQELFLRAAQLEKKSKEVENDLEFVDKQLAELEQFRNHLETLEKSDEKEIFAAIGKGVYVKAEMPTKELFVDVGAGNLVKKTPEETRKVIGEQLKKMKDARMQLAAQSEMYHNSLLEMITQLEESKAK